MSIIKTMTRIALFGVAMQLRYYWAAGVVAALFVFGIWYGKRVAQRREGAFVERDPQR